MHAQPSVTKRQTKKKIRVDFERTSFLERMKIRLLSGTFFTKLIWSFFRLVLLLGISYVILFPFFSKISASFMSSADLSDVTVRLIPKYPTLDTYKSIISYSGYFTALFNTFILSALCGFAQTLVCSFVGYGFAKFKFRGSKLLFLSVILTLVIPHQTLQLSMYMQFRYFDPLGLIGLLGGGVFKDLAILPISSINLTNTYWPLALLSLTGLAFKNGLYIFMMRQFYRGVPDELEESAYIDGAGSLYTFFKIIIPLSIPMLVTIFLFSFSWQWTDQFYTNLFFTDAGPKLMPSLLTTSSVGLAKDMSAAAYNSAAGLLIIAPLIILYLFGQKFLIQGIERSGIVG